MDSNTKTKIGIVGILVTALAFGTGYIISEYKRFKDSDSYDESYENVEEEKKNFKTFIKQEEKKLKEKRDTKKAEKAAKKEGVDPAEAESPQE